MPVGFIIGGIVIAIAAVVFLVYFGSKFTGGQSQ